VSFGDSGFKEFPLMTRKIRLIAIAAGSAGMALFSAQAFAGCEEEIDALSKAISGPVTMTAGHRAAMMRMALDGYDRCMAGDPKSFDGIRDQIMTQIKQSLGGQ
jgi:hypothetical protein